MNQQLSETVVEFDLSVTGESAVGVLDRTFVANGDSAGTTRVYDVPISANSETKEAGRFTGLVVGTIVGFDEAGQPLVDFPGNIGRAPLVARSTVTLEQEDSNREVVIFFERGERQRPIVAGLLQKPKAQPSESPIGASVTKPSLIAVEMDGERLVLTADKEIVLRCGKASITLTRAGKIVILGTYLLNRSSGVNQIKGGSVHIN
jgi:hypothetical protein